MMRHDNILAALGGVERDDGIQRTWNALVQLDRLGPRGLRVLKNDEVIELTLHARHDVEQLIRDMLETRLSVLENEAPKRGPGQL